jgi:hypothetical protein
MRIVRRDSYAVDLDRIVYPISLDNPSAARDMWDEIERQVERFVTNRLPAGEMEARKIALSSITRLMKRVSRKSSTSTGANNNSCSWISKEVPAD